jgi:histidine ammonia-lyase
VLGIELLTAARALALRAPLRPAPATAAVVTALRAAGVGPPGPDRHLAPEIELATEFVRDGRLLTVLDAKVHMHP